MDAWGNFWAKGHSTTFGEYFKNGYTEGYVASWWANILKKKIAQHQDVLEVGCGNASLLPAMLDLRVKGSYTGLDAAPVNISDAVKKRYNANLSISLHGNTCVEDFNTEQTFDLIVSVYGLEYSDTSISLPLLKSRLNPNGKMHLLMHHSHSVITTMSEKALGEFDFDLMETGVDYLRVINDELDKEKGDLKALESSVAANRARGSVNEFISSVMNTEQSERNPILVDFSQALLGYFKQIRSSAEQRAAYICAIMEDFHASKERYRQMVSVARDEKQIDTFRSDLNGAGFMDVDILVLQKDGRPVAWYVSAA
jgi:SAM-dependent methyltransferase